MAILKQAFFWPFTFTDGGGFGEWHDPSFGDVPIWIGNGPFLSPYAYALAVKTALDLNLSTGPHTVGYDAATYRLYIWSASDDLSFNMDTGDTQAAAVSGFSDSGHLISGGGYTAGALADYARLSNLWTPDAAVARDPGGAVYREPDTQVNLSVAGRGKVWFEARQTVRPLRFEFLYPLEVYAARAPSADQTALEYLWLYGRARVRYWTDRAQLFTLGAGLGGDFFLDQDTLAQFAPERMPFQKELYSFELGLRAYV